MALLLWRCSNGCELLLKKRAVKRKQAAAMEGVTVVICLEGSVLLGQPHSKTLMKYVPRGKQLWRGKHLAEQLREPST